MPGLYNAQLYATGSTAYNCRYVKGRYVLTGPDLAGAGFFGASKDTLQQMIRGGGEQRPTREAAEGSGNTTTKCQDHQGDNTDADIHHVFFA